MHFAVADTASELEYTRMQHQRFMEVLDALKEQGTSLNIIHCANSAATIAFPEYAHDMVARHSTYGLAPSDEMQGMADLQPLMSLKTTVAAIRPFEAGITVSYGRTYKTPAPRTIAVCPIGYADGLQRRLSGKLHFLLHGKQIPVVADLHGKCMVVSPMCRKPRWGYRHRSWHRRRRDRHLGRLGRSAGHHLL